MCLQHHSPGCKVGDARVHEIVRTIKHFADSIFSIVHGEFLLRIEIEVHARQFLWVCERRKTRYGSPWVFGTERCGLERADSSMLFIKQTEECAVLGVFLQTCAEMWGFQFVRRDFTDVRGDSTAARGDSTRIRHDFPGVRGDS